jgi:hypothetical protein
MTGAGSSSAEWGPWIEHDGAHIPTEFVVGDVIQLLSEDNQTGTLDESLPKKVEPEDFVRHNWFWGEGSHDVLLYRIRRPDALHKLIDLVENLPAPASGERVTA